MIDSCFMSVECESHLANLRRVPVTDVRFIVLMGPETQSTEFPGSIECPTITFVLRVDLTTNDQKTAFTAAVRAVPCLSNLTFQPWSNGDLLMRRFTTVEEHCQAVSDVEKGLASKYA